MSKKEIYGQIAEGLELLAAGINALAGIEDIDVPSECQSLEKAAEVLKREDKKEDGQSRIKVSLEDIRNVLAGKSQAGLTSKVKELLESFGANKLSSVKEEDYEKLLEAARKL